MPAYFFSDAFQKYLSINFFPLGFKNSVISHELNQPGESQHDKLLLEAKKYFKIKQKDKIDGFEGKNYNPMKHCDWHNQIKTNG